MKTKLLLALCALACASVCAHAQVYTGTALQNSAGNIARIVPFAPVTVCSSTDTAVPCTQKATTYTDTTLGVPCSLTNGNGAPLSGSGCNNPGIADANGNFTFFAAAGNYRICTFAQNYQCVMVPAGSSANGFICGTILTPGLPYWNGTQCALDGGASFDPVAIQWNFEKIVSTGTITAPTFATSGAGGILEMKAQTAPTPGTNLFDIYIDSATGLVHCRNNAAGDCLGAVQFVVSGSTVLPATLVTANGGCNVYSSTATGATSSNGAYTSLHGVDSSAVSGYGPGQLLVYPPFVGTNLISFKVCNPTTSNITPASLTVFWDIK